MGAPPFVRLNETASFGKYRPKNMTWEDILTSDPEYLLWLRQARVSNIQPDQNGVRDLYIEDDIHRLLDGYIKDNPKVRSRYPYVHFTKSVTTDTPKPEPVITPRKVELEAWGQW